jgi:DNA-binding MarR family transcriptional regulator
VGSQPGSENTTSPVDEAERVERTRVQGADPSWALRSFQRAATDLDRALAATLNMGPLDYTAMSHLMASERAVGPTELAGRLRISTGSMTELADRLERAGHLRREPDPTDRRRTALVVTDSGVQDALAPLWELFVHHAAPAGTYTPDQQATITSYLRRAAALLADHATSLEPETRRRAES